MASFFKGALNASQWSTLTSNAQIGVGLHHAMVNMANNGFVESGAIGAAGGAVLGGINGGISDDGSVIGGAFRGAGAGAMAGIGASYMAGAYAKGAFEAERVAGKAGAGNVIEANGKYISNLHTNLANGSISNVKSPSAFKIGHIFDGMGSST